MKNYDITIIVPTYNTSNYIEKCIDSLLNQTINSVEIIIIDDNSEEDYSAVKEKYSVYDNIVFLRNENRLGPGGARNRGLEIAHGKYIAFCDSDDWVELDLYKTVIDVMEKHNSEIGVFPVQRVYDIPMSTPYYLCNYKQVYCLTADVAIKIMLQQYDLGISIPFYCTNKVFRKSFLDSISATFENEIYYQGKLFTIYTFLYAQKIVCVPNVCYKHYRRKNSIIQSFEVKHINDFKQSMLYIKEYLQLAQKYELYKYQYFKLCEKSLDLVIRQIFEFVEDENQKKEYIKSALSKMSELISIDEYFEYTNAEEIRKHIQPHITNTELK